MVTSGFNFQHVLPQASHTSIGTRPDVQNFKRSNWKKCFHRYLKYSVNGIFWVHVLISRPWSTRYLRHSGHGYWHNFHKPPPESTIWQTTTSLPWVPDIPICARSSCRPLWQAVYSSSLFGVSFLLHRSNNNWWPFKNVGVKHALHLGKLSITSFVLDGEKHASTHRFFSARKNLIVMVKPYLARATWLPATQLINMI